MSDTSTYIDIAMDTVIQQHQEAMDSNTASTCTTQCTRHAHQFQIIGYSLKRGLGVGKFIRSGTFHVGGHGWAICYYPDGVGQGQQGYVSVYVQLMSKKAKARALFDLRLVDRTTGSPCSVYRRAEPTVFDSKDTGKCSCRGIRRFMKRSELEASAYVRDDRLTIECVLDVVREPEVSETKAFSYSSVPPSDLSKHLGKLLEEQVGVDITFSVQGEDFSAHKVVLAMRSLVFKAELYGPMKEKEMQQIAIDDMQPAVFKALLHFIYTDVLPVTDDIQAEDYREMIRHLLVAADRYAMERLKLMCEHILCRSLDMKTVATTMALADQHYCMKLKDACAEFIASSEMNNSVVMATQV